ncbi:signal transduction histidine kinase [Xenococcus sp. PCC 7305]|uniref:ATP-binding protein n=1 Tax=Xenococcus sp. PCC 7305 TaxID=102125 RepID=UPI0002AC0716|nr:ATP-binding protein [Xenococcus sp. PCC 7305]ELS00623.1 signal transduction histidine kinase [Xenococcus sp. PCC 7305]
MTSKTKSSLSLYQLVQSINPPPLEIAVSPTTVRSCVAMFLDLLIEQKLSAKIWLKLPQTKSWHQEVRKYQKLGQFEKIYLCSDHLERSAKLLGFEDLAASSLIPVTLTKNAELKRECFLLVITEDFSGLILTQWQKGKIKVNSSGKRLEQPYLKMVLSFQVSVVQKALLGIQKNLVTSRATEQILPAVFKITSTETKVTNFITKLLLKQIEQSESFQASVEQRSLTQNKDIKSAQNLRLDIDFLHNLVAELRSPITHMKTALSLLESKSIKGEQRQRYLKMLERECDRQNSVISGSLELLSLHGPVKAEAVYLNELIPGIVSTYQPLASEKQIQLGYTIPDNLPPVSCPTAWVRQIIIQLLNNSLQFTPPKGRVFVQATSINDAIKLIISDTGRGIEAKDLGKIFDSFYRTKTVTNNEITGAGLGLTIVHKLVESAGGSILVNSKLNKGSSFRILLPTVPPELIEDRC